MRILPKNVTLLCNIDILPLGHRQSLTWQVLLRGRNIGASVRSRLYMVVSWASLHFFKPFRPRLPFFVCTRWSAPSVSSCVYIYLLARKKGNILERTYYTTVYYNAVIWCWQHGLGRALHTIVRLFYAIIRRCICWAPPTWEDRKRLFVSEDPRHVLLLTPVSFRRR